MEEVVTGPADALAADGPPPAAAAVIGNGAVGVANGVPNGASGISNGAADAAGEGHGAEDGAEEEDDAGEASGSAGTVRRELVALLLAFLKEYYLRDEESAIKAMLRDTCATGLHPRPLGKWGLMSLGEVGEAIAAFEVWKDSGCLYMPILYYSPSYQEEIPGFITAKRSTAGGSKYTLENINPQGEQSWKRSDADPNNVRPDRSKVGWWAPSADAEAVNVEHPEQEVQPAAASSATPTPVAPGRIQTVTFAFDGSSYGPDYLVLNPGDEINWLEEDQGWSRGKVVRRQVVLPHDRPGALVDVGWYPASFVKEQDAVA